MDSAPLAEIVLDRIDAIAGFDHLADCIVPLEAAFDRWQSNGAPANFALLVAAASPVNAVIVFADQWPPSDGACTDALAREAVLQAVAYPDVPQAAGVITAGLSLLLGPEGRAQQQRDAAVVRAAGSVPLCVGLLAEAAGDWVEVFVTTIGIAPRVLN